MYVFDCNAKLSLNMNSSTDYLSCGIMSCGKPTCWGHYIRDQSSGLIGNFVENYTLEQISTMLKKKMHGSLDRRFITYHSNALLMSDGCETLV